MNDTVNIPRAVYEEILAAAKRIETMDTGRTPVSVAGDLGACKGIAFGIVIKLETYSQVAA